MNWHVFTWIRHNLDYVSWKQRKEIAADLKPICQAPTAEEAGMNLELFEKKWNKNHPSIGKSRRRNGERITPLFSYPPDIRNINP